MSPGLRRGQASLGTAVAGAIAAALVVAYAESQSGGWDAQYLRLLARGTGWCAVGALLLSLNCTPAQRLSRRLSGRIPLLSSSAWPAFARWRRTLGLGGAVFALAHAALCIRGPLDGAFEALLSWPFLRAGVVAIAILAVLSVTSFPRALRLLRIRAFKELHRLAHAALLLVLLHLALGPHAPRWATVVVAAIYGALVAVRAGYWLASGRRTSP